MITFLKRCVVLGLLMIAHSLGFYEGEKETERRLSAELELTRDYRAFVREPMCYAGCRMLVNGANDSHSYWDCVERVIAEEV